MERHLGQFGEIRITRLEPETAVAWEGAHASGTVRLEPSGWGTRVILTAGPLAAPGPAPEPEPSAPELEFTAGAAPLPGRRRGLLARFIGLFRSPLPPADRFEPPAPTPPLSPEPAVTFARDPSEPGLEPSAPEPSELDPSLAGELAGQAVDQAEQREKLDPARVLVAALDSLGQAHRRPFSRS